MVVWKLAVCENYLEDRLMFLGPVPRVTDAVVLRSCSELCFCNGFLGSTHPSSKMVILQKPFCYNFLKSLNFQSWKLYCLMFGNAHSIFPPKLMLVWSVPISRVCKKRTVTSWIFMHDEDACWADVYKHLCCLRYLDLSSPLHSVYLALSLTEFHWRGQSAFFTQGNNLFFFASIS